MSSGWSRNNNVLGSSNGEKEYLLVTRLDFNAAPSPEVLSAYLVDPIKHRQNGPHPSSDE